MALTTDYIFKCPQDTEYDTMDTEAREIIKSMLSEWPSFPMPGTVIKNGYGMLHVRMDTLLLKSELENLFTFFSLDWTVLSIRNAYDPYDVTYISEKGDFLPFFDENYGIDDDIYLSTYLGTDSIKL